MKLFFFYMNKYGKRLVYNFMRCNLVKLIAFHLAIISNSEKSLLNHFIHPLIIFFLIGNPLIKIIRIVCVLELSN